MAIKLGLDGKAYYSETPLSATPTTSLSLSDELTNIKNCTLNLNQKEADVTTRANNGWSATVGTLKEGSVEFEMVWDSEDDGFTAIQTAWLGRALLAMAFLDGAVGSSGSQGLAGNFSITGFSREENLEGAMITKVTVKPASYTNWVTIAGT